MNKVYTEALINKMCNKPRSLDYIVQHLNGVDPISVLEFLKELEQKDKIRSQQGLWLNEAEAQTQVSDIIDLSANVYLKKYMGDTDFFKKPHPLDYEWRNTMQSIEYLGNLVVDINESDNDILILGMPTLFAHLCRQKIKNKLTIVERNSGVITALKELTSDDKLVLEADIFMIEPEKVGMYSTVVMDPPWYEPHFYQFIWLASRCLKLGGRLLISIPPINTRPGIGEERIRWFSFCQKQGICLQNLVSNKLQYSMPFFEWNATRSAGALTHPFWRKGDLAIFQKLVVEYVERPLEKGEYQAWKEIEINTTRVRIKIDTEEDSKDEMIIESLVQTQILPSVSSRDPRRNLANVWTSGNRIFKTNKPKKLYTYLQLVKADIPDSSEEAAKVFDFIGLISNLEKEEYNNYLEWLYHGMEGDTY